ncbi:MAG TPA: radical SAM protein, partial [Mycobacteriales bacterium]|nr:radical SAM protein [Mycobacteriales bacterium]
MSPALPDGEPVARDGSLPEHVRGAVGRAPFGFYVHIPFCASRCGYCDFNTYTAQELPGVSRSSYVELILAELRLARYVLRERVPTVRTVFFGGGTPSLLPAGHLVAVLREIDELFGLAADAEITTEANPESVTAAYLSRLREGGFNRLSLGMQSAVPEVLKVLDRQHTP